MKADHDLLPDGLQRMWLAWRETYSDLAARNPRLELSDLMSEISEANNASSWPNGNETEIEDWVLAGDESRPPISGMLNNMPSGTLARMAELRQEIRGWLHWAGKEDGVRYVPEAEWLVLKEEQKQQRAEIGNLARRYADIVKSIKDNAP